MGKARAFESRGVAMRKNITVVAMALVVLVAVLCGTLSSLAGNTVHLDGSGLTFDNPQNQARATAIAQEALDAAAARAIERQAQLAQAQAVQAAKPAMTARNTMMAFGVGAFVLILGVGSSFALIAWLNKRATSVYPNASGQYPVIIKKTWDGVIVHDANRAIGPTTVYTVPSLQAGVAQRLGLPVVGEVNAQGQAASEQAHIQITSQAQAVSALSAITRPRGLLGGNERRTDDTLKLAQAVMGGGNILPDSGAALPTPRIIDDVEQIGDFAKLLESGGE